MKTVSEEMVVSIDSPDPMYDDTFTIYPSNLTGDELESAIVIERLSLYNNGKPCGAQALRKHLQYLGLMELPSVRTITRILARHCLTYRRMGYYAKDDC